MQQREREEVREEVQQREREEVKEEVQLKEQSTFRNMKMDRRGGNSKLNSSRRHLKKLYKSIDFPTRKVGRRSIPGCFVMP